MSEKPDYAAYWAALLKRHKALIAACVAYHGRLPFAAPLACDVIDAAGVLHRAEYVPDSMLDGAAQYAIDGATYELQRNGELVAVAEQERRAA